MAPIASFIGWLYIVFRRPYHVGDRIQLDSLRGDVVEIGYLDTLIRECSGSYLGNDRSSGRRNRILRRALPALNAQPDKVQSPQGAQL